MKWPAAGAGKRQEEGSGIAEVHRSGERFCVPPTPERAWVYPLRPGLPGGSLRHNMQPVTIIVIIGVVLIAAAVVYLVVRSRRPKEEPYHHFNCPNCRRRLRYRERQVGHPGQCPQCKSPLVFPSIGGVKGK
jgi:hypothetical protein